MTRSSRPRVYVAGPPVVGWRGDLRSAGDDEGAVVHLQVPWFVERSGGGIERALDAALDRLAAVLEKE